MKRIITYLSLIFSLLFIPNIVSAEEVNLYLFHSQDCSHCAAEREWLDSIKNEYDNLNIHEYEVTRNKENSELHEKVKKRLSSTSQYVPFTVVGEEYWIGWNENNKDKIIDAIENYDYGKRDIVNEVINNIPGENIEPIEEENNDDASFTVPVLGKIDAKKVSLKWDYVSDLGYTSTVSGTTPSPILILERSGVQI